MPIPSIPSPLTQILATKTYDSNWFSGSTIEQQIQNAINAASADGAERVLVHGPYDASLVTFNTNVQMTWEGGDWSKYDVRAYGATGINPTIGIQAAIDAAGSTGIAYIPRATYLIKSRGSKLFRVTSGVTSSFNYCIDLPTGSKLLVESGTVLQLTAGQTDTVALSNRRTSEISGAGLDLDITINGQLIIDGNNVSFTNSALVWFNGVTKLNIDWLRIINAKHLAGYLVDLDKAYLNHLELDTVTGQGWTIGQNATSQEIRDSYIGTIIARNITQESEPNFPGNPLIFVGVRCTIDTIIGENHGASVKIMRPSADVQIGKVHLKTSSNSIGNSGLSMFGDATKLKRVNVGLVYATGQLGRGLYIDDCEDVSIASFIGLNNTPTLAFPDVWIGGDRVSIGTIISEGAGQHAVLIRSNAVDYNIGRITALNPSTQLAGFPAVESAGGNGAIESIIVKDNRGGGALMDRALEITSASAVIRVGSVISSGHTDKPVHFSIAGGDANARVNMGGVTSPAALTTGNNNDYNTGDSQTLRLSADAAGSTITGISQGYVGRRLRIINVSANALTLAHQSGSSTSGNRLLSPTAANIVLSVDDSAELEYDDSTDRWRIVNVQQ